MQADQIETHASVLGRHERQPSFCVLSDSVTDPHGQPPACVILQSFCQCPGIVLAFFSLHHETLTTAGCILAYNKPGLFTSCDDRVATRVDAALDSIIPASKYHYHLHVLGTDLLSPICRDFEFSRLHLPRF